jgi:hypothetical protein
LPCYLRSSGSTSPPSQRHPLSADGLLLS